MTIYKNMKKIIKNKIKLSQNPSKPSLKKTTRNALRIQPRLKPIVNLNVSMGGRKNLRNNIKTEDNPNINSGGFDVILDKLKKNETFSFLRFGDADYLMMFDEYVGKIVGGNNQFVVTPKLSQELKEAHSIIDNNYCIGSILHTNERKNKLYSYVGFVHKYSKKINETGINQKNMISAVSLTETYYDDINKFYELVREFKKTKTLFIGSYYHENLDLIYGEIIHHIKTKPKNSYVDVDKIFKEILENIDNVDKIIFSCGQTARVLIKRLWELGIEKTMLDVGSLSDYFILNTELGDKIQLRGHIKKNRENIENNYIKLIEIMNEDLSMFGGWAIDVECYQKILEILPAGKTILEFGSGHATNKLAETYTMYSVEHDEKWVNKYKSTYIHAPIVRDFNEPMINWYNPEAIKNNLPEHYDLILVDGPIGALTANGLTRDGFRRNKHLFNLDNTIIVFDDIQRKGEMDSMNMLVKELGRRVEIFDSGAGQKNKKMFGVIYP